MALDRNIPRAIGRVSRFRNTPIRAIVLTTAMVVAVVMGISDLATAGAAASLIFLVSFALTHWAAILARMRVAALPFRAP